MVPASAAQVSPYELMQTYVTASDFLGGPPPSQDIIDILSRSALSDVVKFAAYWLNRVEHPGALASLIERQYVDMYFADDTHRLASTYVQQGRRFLLPQLLLNLTKAALAFCPDASDEAFNEAHLAIAMLGVADMLERGEDFPTDWSADEHGWGGLPPKLALEITTNLYFKLLV